MSKSFKQSVPIPLGDASQRPAAGFRSRTVAALLALVFGVIGAQWWYLRRPMAWCVGLFSLVCLMLASREPVWYDTPAFFLACVSVIAGIIEAAVLALMPNASFDRRYNPTFQPATRTRLPDVLIALASVLAGGVVGMSVLAMVVMHVFVRMGWLDGLVY